MSRALLQDNIFQGYSDALPHWESNLVFATFRLPVRFSSK